MKNIEEMLLEALLELERRVNDPEYNQPMINSSGICGHVWNIVDATYQDYTGECDDYLEFLISEWPGTHFKSNGWRDLAYPVDGSDEFYENIHTPEMWKNPRRRELLSWLIARLQGA